MLPKFNSFERVKRRELKYSVNGVSRRVSLANNSPFRKSYFSLSIKALPCCKLQSEYYCWNHNAVYCGGTPVGVFYGVSETPVALKPF